MKEAHAILEFSDVTLAAAPLEHAGLSQVNAAFLPGTLSIIRVEPGNEQLPLADLAQGLKSPTEGSILFQGGAWDTMSAEQALACRARIGRAFDGHGWISNLNVNENVTLAQRHHTGRAIAEILAEAEALARAFGLAELPKVRPALAPRQDLRRAEWIRAFLGQPRLVLLERPMQGVAWEHLSRLVGAVREACSRKAAVLWLSDTDRIEQAAELPPTTRYAMRGTTLVAMKNG
ncbi:MAG: hypothetical protein HYV36_00750 [Lentisphaerae bacterium]|nr:hypothetical protein [Lentisphaerota bacterium]